MIFSIVDFQQYTSILLVDFDASSVLFLKSSTKAEKVWNIYSIFKGYSQILVWIQIWELTWPLQEKDVILNQSLSSSFSSMHRIVITGEGYEQKTLNFLAVFSH